MVLDSPAVSDGNVDTTDPRDKVYGLLDLFQISPEIDSHRLR